MTIPYKEPLPLPAYLFDDDQLYALIDQIEQITAETGGMEDFDRIAIKAVEIELSRRGKPAKMIRNALGQ